jgi:hypothetical protein
MSRCESDRSAAVAGVVIVALLSAPTLGCQGRMPPSGNDTREATSAAGGGTSNAAAPISGEARMTDDQVRGLAHQVAGLLDDYIRVHDDMLGRQGSSVLTPINFSRDAALLSKVAEGLDSAKQERLRLRASGRCDSRHLAYLAEMDKYLDVLHETVSVLTGIATRMDRKAQGDLSTYDMVEYKRDMETYFACVERYTAQGKKLVDAWNAAGL